MLLIKEQTQKTYLFITSLFQTINVSLFGNTYFLSNLKFKYKQTVYDSF